MENMGNFMDVQDTLIVKADGSIYDVFLNTQKTGAQLHITRCKRLTSKPFRLLLQRERCAKGRAPRQ